VKGEVLNNFANSNASEKRLGKKKAFELQRNGVWRGAERGVTGFIVQNTRS
jgi:hypothetical protein